MPQSLGNWGRKAVSKVGGADRVKDRKFYMKYGKIVEGKFIDRPNRFIAHVEIAGKAETVHVKNTGRCRELLLPWGSGASGTVG